MVKLGPNRTIGDGRVDTVLLLAAPEGHTRNRRRHRPRAVVPRGDRARQDGVVGVDPATVSAEVCYLLERRAGSKSEAAFLRLFPAGRLVPVDITAADYERMAELVELYDDWPLGGTDASLIAIAERLRVTKVATLDRRHYGPIQPAMSRHFLCFRRRCDDVTPPATTSEFASSTLTERHLGRHRTSRGA